MLTLLRLQFFVSIMLNLNEKHARCDTSDFVILCYIQCSVNPIWLQKLWIAFFVGHLNYEIFLQSMTGKTLILTLSNLLCLLQ